MPASRASSRSRAGGNGRPYAACSRSHHPAPTPTNARPPVSASSVAAALAVMPGRPEGDRGDEGAQPEPGVEAGDQPERHPRLRDRLPGPVDLRDLDEVVHHREPGEPGLVGGQRHRPQPGAGVLAPREPRQLQHHGEPLRRAAVGGGGRSRESGVSATTGESGRTTWTRSQPSASSSARTSREALELRGQGGGRDDVRAVGVAAARLLGRGVDHDGDRRQPGGSRRLEPGRGDARGRGRGCRRRWSARGRAGRRRCARGSRRPRRWRRGRALRCRRRRGGRRTTRSPGRGSGPGRMRLARPRGSDEDQECGIGQVLGHNRECGSAGYEATPL